MLQDSGNARMNAKTQRCKGAMKKSKGDESGPFYSIFSLRPGVHCALAFIPVRYRDKERIT
jgi:hypothetical protein